MRDGVLQVVDPSGYHEALAAMALGDGEEVVVRIERPADAVTRGQRAHYFGHLIAPVVDYTGDPDWHLILKAVFLPDGKTSITECSYEEMDAYTKACEQFLYLCIPEAFVYEA